MSGCSQLNFRQEFQSLCNYFKSKEIKIKGLNNVTAAAAARDSDEEGQGREARKVAQAAVQRRPLAVSVDVLADARGRRV